jgi:N-acetylmuramoyl-L-alanine amidase
MKIAVDLGHGVNPDRGAVGIKSEEDMINATGKKLIELLKAAGHSILEVRPKKATSVNDSLRQRVEAANSWGADLYISVHFNAFNGKASGEEVFATSEVGKRYASAVSHNLAALEFNNRGVKDGGGLYVIKNTNMPAILVEGCFVDSPEDIARFSADKIAKAIADGIK